MQNDSACRRKTFAAREKKRKRRGKEAYLARLRRCCWLDFLAGDVVVEAGGGVVAHRRRLQAVLWLFEQRRERDFFPFSSLPLIFCGSLCPFFVLGLFFSFVIFRLFLLFLLSRSFSLFSLSSFGLSSFSFFSFFSPLLPFSLLFSIYRSERALRPSLVRMGSGFRGGWLATTRDNKAPLPCF